MTDEAVNSTVENNEETPTEAPQTPALAGTTAFIVIRKPNGSWQVVTELSQPFAVAQSATILDIKQGCREVLGAIQTSETAWAVVNQLKSENAKPE